MTLDIRGTLARPGDFRLSLDVCLPDGGVTAIIGRSGSGKSTILRVIAGLERDTTFSVRFRGTTWQDDNQWTPPHHRPVAMVQQRPALFPHLSVLGNLRATANATNLDEALERFELLPLLDRKPHALSGGQQQRVALARAYVKPAALWLFDEPLSSLDPLARNELAPMIANLCRESGRPVLYVTHSLQEVLQIADHLVMLEEGSVIGSGTPEQVAGELDHPLSPLIDVGAILDCEFHGYDARHNLSELRVGANPIWVRGDLSAPGGTIRIQIPARDVTLAKQIPADTSILNCLPAEIVELRATPDRSMFVELDCVGQRLRSRITELSAERMGLSNGLHVYALIKSVALDARSI